MLKPIILLILSVLITSCVDPSITKKENNNINNSNNSNNINNSNNTNFILNNGNCSTAQDNKLTQINWFHTKIYNGSTRPGICISSAQSLAVGAYMEFNSNNDAWENKCTGTLITDHIVLTAAHCVFNSFQTPVSPSEARFAIGNDASSPQQMFTISSIIANPDYDPWSDYTGNDHALLILDESPADYADIAPIPMYQSDLSDLRKVYLQQVGYGATQSDYDNSKKWWTMELIDSVDNEFGEMTVNGQGFSSVCDGDSGGPSLYSIDGNSLSILGTVSWGDASCVDYDHYGLVSFDSDFLNPQLGNFDYCGDLTSEGTCDGTSIATWCENGTVRTECCDEITGPCTVSDGQARCSNRREKCDSVNFQGECNGNIAKWCFNGYLYHRDCADCNQQCVDTGNSVIGYYCASPSNIANE